MTDIAPGWYKDPADPSTQRWWDGEGWIGAALPADAPAPDGPPAPEPAPMTPPPTAIATPPPGTTQNPAPGGGPGAPPWSHAPYPAPPHHPGGQHPGGQHPGSPQAGPPQAAPPQAAPAQVGWPQPGVPAQFDPGVGYPGAPQPYPGMPHGYPGMPYPGMPEAAPRPHGLPLAGLDARFGARVIDILVVGALAVVVNAWFAYQWVLEMQPLVQAVMEAPGSNPTRPARLAYLEITMLLITTALWLAYEVPALGNTGQTLGKRVMGIKVVRAESMEPLGFGRAFRRWRRLGLLTPLAMPGLCFVGLVLQIVSSASVLFDKPLHRAWHDKLAGTVVVQLPRGMPSPGGADNGTHPSDRTGGAR
jgi:uncharacterized RDD family membrane protein YckC